MTSAWMVTSRAVVASSAMSRAGSQEMAMAIRTRWSMPPDSSAGIWVATRAGSRRPTAASSSTARARAALRDRPTLTRSTSTSCWPTVRDGLR
jgi:hypothetical protein